MIVKNVLHGKAKFIAFVVLKPGVVVGVEVTSDHSAVGIFIIDFCQKVTEFIRVVGKFDRRLAKFSIREYKE